MSYDFGKREDFGLKGTALILYIVLGAEKIPVDNS